MSATGDPTHARLQSLSSLLSQYYGSAKGAESTNTPRVNVNDIDGARFDSNKYVKKLLDEVPLEELMQRDQKLSKGDLNLRFIILLTLAEIKKLDTDLQMLVYENYNKFITATDTIKKVFLLNFY